MDAKEFWEYYPEERDSTYFLDEYYAVDMEKVFGFAEEYHQAKSEEEAQERYNKAIKYVEQSHSELCLRDEGIGKKIAQIASGIQK
jgi:hypothetical protein